ncbi:hypothetical protein GCM10009422_10830 [Brevundimonas kwangchunensis]|uniref:Uncharacterized protein n=1 Tax=Brevundimonas kwangchunensis TaxID=322163 RepID=A0ABN1GRL7_9CAUL
MTIRQRRVVSFRTKAVFSAPNGLEAREDGVRPDPCTQPEQGVAGEQGNAGAAVMTTPHAGELPCV